MKVGNYNVATVKDMYEALGDIVKMGGGEKILLIPNRDHEYENVAFVFTNLDSIDIDDKVVWLDGFTREEDRVIDAELHI